MGWPSNKTTKNASEALFSELILAINQVSGRAAGDTSKSIHPGSFLGADLGLSSLAVARLAGILQKRLGRGPLPFYTLFEKPDGTLVQDVRVSDVIAFLERHLSARTP